MGVSFRVYFQSQNMVHFVMQFATQFAMQLANQVEAALRSGALTSAAARRRDPSTFFRASCTVSVFPALSSQLENASVECFADRS